VVDINERRIESGPTARVSWRGSADGRARPWNKFAARPFSVRSVALSLSLSPVVRRGKEKKNASARACFRCTARTVRFRDQVERRRASTRARTCRARRVICGGLFLRDRSGNYCFVGSLAVSPLPLRDYEYACSLRASARGAES